MAAPNILQAARGWIGTPFKHQGRQKGIGVDCAGLIVGVARETGHHYADLKGYGRIPSKNTLVDMLNQHANKVPKSNCQAGDILLMKFRGNPQHLGFYTGHGIIHSWQGAGKCVEHGLDAVWRNRIASVYRMFANG